MTREEAKRIIEQSDYFWIRPTPEEREALSMAIEALKAQDVVEELTQDLADKLNDAYNIGYNAAKREIALSGEYERAYKRGVKDAKKNCEECEFGNPCLYCKHEFKPQEESEEQEDEE